MTVNLSHCIGGLHSLNISLVGCPSEITLKSKETAELKFLFAPKTPRRDFAIPVIVEAAGSVIPLVSLTGACCGLEAKLDCMMCFY
jgi:hypothetical protein